MAKICITKAQEEKIKKAVADGEFSLSKIQETKSSAERLELVDGFLGNKEVSKQVVRDIEKQLDLKIRFRPNNDAWRSLKEVDKSGYTRATDELKENVLTKEKELQGSQSFKALGKDEQSKVLDKLWG